MPRKAQRKILAIDCSFGGHSVAIATPSGLLAECHHPYTLPSEGVIESVDKVLRRAGVKLSELACLSFGSGPGLFSGIRAACTVVQGFAHVFNLNVVPVPTTMALAQLHCTKNALVAYPAHKGHCYISALKRKGKAWDVALEPSLFPTSELPEFSGDWELCGRKINMLRKKLELVINGASLACHSHRSSLAGTVALLGLALESQGKAVDPVLALPNYVRNKVAYTKSERDMMKKVK